MKAIIIVICIFLSLSAHADLEHTPAHGFHWYTKPAPKKIIKAAHAPKLSPYQQLLEMRKQTMDKLANALINPSFDTTLDYMQVQQNYAKNNQKFVQNWQKVLLAHPELDYSLHAPTNNTAIATRNDVQNQLITKILNSTANSYGLIYFYSGESAISQKMSASILDFVHEYHFSMIAITTDGKILESLPNSKSIPLAIIQQKLNIKKRYMPALFLVNTKTQKMSALSYGFVAINDLKSRFLDVATDFKRFSYEGLEGF